jgi:hypothetical protein
MWGSVRAAIAPLVATALLLAGCSSADEPSEASSPAPEEATSVSVVLTDWSVTADPASSAPGPVAFEIDSTGNHGLTVLRTDLPPGDLPTLGPVAVDVTDERIEVITTEGARGGTRSLEADLDPGSYALICNQGGHYVRGMWTGFRVE